VLRKEGNGEKVAFEARPVTVLYVEIEPPAFGFAAPVWHDATKTFHYK